MTGFFFFFEAATHCCNYSAVWAVLAFSLITLRGIIRKIKKWGSEAPWQQLGICHISYFLYPLALSDAQFLTGCIWCFKLLTFNQPVPGMNFKNYFFQKSYFKLSSTAPLTAPLPKFFTQITKKLMQQTLLLMNSSSDSSFWLAALDSSRAVKFSRTKPHLLPGACCKQQRPCDVRERPWAVGVQHQMGGWKKKKKEIVESGPPPQTDDALYEFF